MVSFFLLVSEAVKCNFVSPAKEITLRLSLGIMYATNYVIHINTPKVCPDQHLKEVWLLKMNKLREEQDRSRGDHLLDSCSGA